VNFSEQLAYWYLRLNGFFPLTNFVLHHHGTGERHSSDADIVAVRFPTCMRQLEDRLGLGIQDLGIGVNAHASMRCRVTH
jgi:hypothetical protein